MTGAGEFTVRDLYRSLDQRKRPEDVALMVLAAGQPSEDVRGALRAVSRHARRYSYMSQDFHRSFASLGQQVKVASLLFAATAPGDPDDEEAVRQYLVRIEAEIGKAVGRSDFKQDRLNKGQRRERGLDLSRRQYNKRFRLAARMEDKARRRAREMVRRGLTLASKSRLASQLTWEQFSSDTATACFIAYYVARCNLRSVFTVNSQVRPYDAACEAMMKVLRLSRAANWFAVAHVMPDEDVVKRLTDREKGELLGRYYEMLIKAGGFLREVWESSEIAARTMIVRRGNDSSTWNLMAGAWNKLRDGWFSLLHALGAGEVLERQCFGKVMRLMAADVARWHRSTGKTLHTDTDVWATLPLPWKVLAGEASCTRRQIEETCDRFGIDPLKSGWIARRGGKVVEPFAPTPELVHGVVVSSPDMARAMRKAGVFSGKTLRLQNADVDLDHLIEEVHASRMNHYVTETLKSEEAAG
jgi:hypothetical protein